MRLVAQWPLTLTLEPIKSDYVHYIQCSWLDVGLIQSPLEDVPFDVWEGPESSVLAGGQLLALWEGVQNSLCLFTMAAL